MLLLQSTERRVTMSLACSDDWRATRWFIKLITNQHPVDSTSNNRDDEQTVYVFEFESESNEKEESLQEGKETPNGKQPFIFMDLD